MPFSEEIAKCRIQEERNREAEKGPVEREDMFHFLCTARDPDSGDFALTIEELIADTNMLIIAGSDTTSSTICALFFYITHHPRVYTKLVKGVRENF